MRGRSILSAQSTIFSKREVVLEEIAAVYAQPEIGLLAISRFPRLPGT
jgi:hypothetical protein